MKDKVYYINNTNKFSKDSNIVISFIGDLYIGNMVKNKIYNIGLNKVKEELWSFVDGSDLIIGNFESAIVENEIISKVHPNGFTGNEGCPTALLTSKDILQVFDKRFVLCIANNHVMDYGNDGLINTVDNLKASGQNFSGAGKNMEEAGKPAIVECNGVKIGVICAADPRFNSSSETTPGTFPAKRDLLEELFGKLKNQTDLIIASLHLGMMYCYPPNPIMVSLAELCLELGAKIVHFHHSHLLSGVSNYERGAVIWGSGNYIFTNRNLKNFKSLSRSAVFTAIFNKNDNSICKLDITPVQLSPEGLPIKANPTESERIKKIVRLWTKKNNNPKRMKYARLLSLFNFNVIFRLVVPGYIYRMKNKGVKNALMTLISSIKTTFGKTKP